MAEEIRDYLRERAEQELASAEREQDEGARRQHYLRAGLYLNRLYGGDPRLTGETGCTY